MFFTYRGIGCPWGISGLTDAGAREGRLRLEKGGTMSSRRLRFVLPAVLGLALAGTSIATAASREHGKSKSQATHFATKMMGHNETPAVHTDATGTLSLTINDATDTISYSETYSNLSSPVLFSHVHFGQPF